jgi:hypothetical protein
MWVHTEPHSGRLERVRVGSCLVLSPTHRSGLVKGLTVLGRLPSRAADQDSEVVVHMWRIGPGHLLAEEVVAQAQNRGST